MRVEPDAMDRLCQPFNCSVGELFEFVPDSDGQ
ncbi:MAG: helix-turn-helix domain-containing protein [Thiohalospira sp.]